VADLDRLADALDVVGALEMEAFLAPVDPRRGAGRAPLPELAGDGRGTGSYLPAAGCGNPRCHAICRIP
jgi:hypothetical protein